MVVLRVCFIRRRCAPANNFRLTNIKWSRSSESLWIRFTIDLAVENYNIYIEHTFWYFSKVEGYRPCLNIWYQSILLFKKIKCYLTCLLISSILYLYMTHKFSFFTHICTTRTLNILHDKSFSIILLCSN